MNIILLWLISVWEMGNLEYIPIPLFGFWPLSESVETFISPSANDGRVPTRRRARRDRSSGDVAHEHEGGGRDEMLNK